MINSDNHGGTILYGGKVDVSQRYVEPTLVENPKLTSQMMQEEIFGPILPIYEFEKIEDAIKFINERPKPLALYYFGKPFFNGNKDKVMKETSSGAFVVNEACFHLINSDLPFGGVGNSGIGAYHGKRGFENVSHLKPVFDKQTINVWPFSSRFPPYTNAKINVLKFLFNHANYH